MTAPDTLYHYCSTESFTSILRTHSVWLSSLNLSNDSMEGRMVNATVLRLAEKDGLDADALRRLRESLSFTERTLDGLGFCLSEDGDLLSQWRGYADDGRGVAIGFSRSYLEWLAKSSRGAYFAPQRLELFRIEFLNYVLIAFRQSLKLLLAHVMRLPPMFFSPC